MSEYKGPIPNKSQIKYHNEEMACFMHFGMNTFTEVEWGNGRENLSDFKLKEFDYDGYVKQDYLPDGFVDEKFYNPKNIGYEKILNESLEKIKRGNKDEIKRD